MKLVRRTCGECGGPFVLPRRGRGGGRYPRRCPTCVCEGRRATTERDPPLPLGAKTYLAWFDRYLAAVIAGDWGEQDHTRRQMSVQCDLMLEAAKVERTGSPRPH
ncbi:MAG: hypothetical protein QOJ29_3686, partial [Thermoleophilaceae bacterium]|nr:hypothetical protein [Thermoleophilaceae bacterium]